MNKHEKQIFAFLCVIVLISCTTTNKNNAIKTSPTSNTNFDMWTATKDAKWAECQALDNLAIVDQKVLMPNAIISGPAEIITNPPTAIIDLWIALGKGLLGTDGIIVADKNSVVIPRELTLVSTKTPWTPKGNVTTYTSDELMWKHIECWNIYKSP